MLVGSYIYAQTASTNLSVAHTALSEAQAAAPQSETRKTSGR